MRSGTDRRAVSLQLTDRARELAPRLAAIADQNDEDFFGVLTTAELQAFKRTLAKLLASQAVDPTQEWSEACDE